MSNLTGDSACFLVREINNNTETAFHRFLEMLSINLFFYRRWGELCRLSEHVVIVKEMSNFCTRLIANETELNFYLY